MKTKLFWRIFGVLWFIVVGAWGLLAETSHLQPTCNCRRDDPQSPFGLTPSERPTVTLMALPTEGKSGAQDVRLEMDGVTNKWRSFEISLPNQHPSDPAFGFPMSLRAGNDRSRIRWSVSMEQALRQARRPLAINVKWSDGRDSLIVSGVIPEKLTPGATIWR